MGHILGVKFRDSGQVYFFASGPYVVNVGDQVIVNTEQGYGLARVVQLREAVPAEFSSEELKPIYRVAAAEDVEKSNENEMLAVESFKFCRNCIRERDLEMKLVDVEVFFDRSKIVFYFTAPNRIDFRELVKDLVKNYRTRIELRQIGVRHETQMVGAIGNCGQVCCCRRFLRKFAPVTIKMAKEQNLFLNPTKISGICGRLLCCLSYEQENYETFNRQCPKIGKKFNTPQGMVKVLRSNMFRRSLFVLTEGGEEKEITLEEWKTLDLLRLDAPGAEAAAAESDDADMAPADAQADDPAGLAEIFEQDYGDSLERAESAELAEPKPESRPRQNARSTGRLTGRPSPENKPEAKAEPRTDGRPDRAPADDAQRRDSEKRDLRMQDKRSKRKRKRKPKPKPSK